MTRTVTTVDTRSSKSHHIPPAICYRLSDQNFLDAGWTTKPNISLAQPVVTMKAKFSHPVISPWFRERAETVRAFYPNGNVLYIAKEDGTGKIFYPNGKLAIRIEKGGINNYRTRVWVKSPGEIQRDGVYSPPQLCALFDSLGNGVVYDDCMRKRLVYNQSEGELLDSPCGIPIRWKWHNIQYTGSMSLINEEDNESSLIPETPKTVICTAPANPRHSKDKFIVIKESASDVSALDASGLDLSLSELSTKLTKSEIDFRENFEHRLYINTAKMWPLEVSPIKPINLQINSYISIKIWDQPNISLSFFAQGCHTQLKIGVLYNPFEKLKVTEVEDANAQEGVLCSFESFPALTKSMAKFKEIVQKIKARNCPNPGN